jgi:HEAT repeat protein
VTKLHRKRIDHAMDPVIPSLVGTGFFLGRFLYKYWRLQYLQRVLTSCGLRVLEVSTPFALRKRLKAQGGSLEVRVKGSLRGPLGIQVAIVIPGPPGFSGMRLRRELYKPLGAREIEVGDKSFDDSFFIEGPMRLVFTLLDEEARRLLISLNAKIRTDGEPLEIRRGELRVETWEGNLSNILPTLLDIGERFSQTVDVAQRLAANATQDPEAGVRRMNLMLLAREFPGEPGTLEVLRSACSDPSPAVRLRAARELGAEGRGVLVEIAESLADDDLSAEAVSLLGRELPFERVEALLVLALHRPRLRTALACLESLGQSGAAEAVGVLSKVMAREKGELATVAAKALGTAGDPAAEGPLIHALHSPQKDLRVAAATALGRVGSPAAVLPLK